MVIVVQAHRFRYPPGAPPKRLDRIGTDALEPRVTTIRHRTRLARIRVQIVAEYHHRVIFFLLPAEPDARFRADALDKRERGLVVLRDVLVPLVLAAQVELEIDTCT